MLNFKNLTEAKKHFTITKVKQNNVEAGCFQFSKETLRHFGNQTMKAFAVWVVEHNGKGYVFLLEKWQGVKNDHMEVVGRKTVNFLRLVRPDGSMTTPIQVNGNDLHCDNLKDFKEILPSLFTSPKFWEDENSPSGFMSVDESLYSFTIGKEEDESTGQPAPQHDAGADVSWFCGGK